MVGNLPFEPARPNALFVKEPAPAGLVALFDGKATWTWYSPESCSRQLPISGSDYLRPASTLFLHTTRTAHELIDIGLRPNTARTHRRRLEHGSAHDNVLLAVYGWNCDERRRGDAYENGDYQRRRENLL